VTQLRGGIGVQDRLTELGMPTLVIWGRHDHIFPVRHAEAAKDKLPNGRVVIFDDSGHTPQMEEPERFNRLVLDFLGAPASRSGEGVA
jgi:proline iminopeptidase